MRYRSGDSGSLAADTWFSVTLIRQRIDTKASRDSIAAFSSQPDWLEALIKLFKFSFIGGYFPSVILPNGANEPSQRGSSTNCS